MGGLDSRYLVSKMGWGDRVASLTTISTPHRGSNIADVLLKVIPGDFDGAPARARRPSGREPPGGSAQGSDVLAALNAISESYTQSTFNQDVIDDPRVTYLSWAGVSNVAAIPGLGNDNDACDGLRASLEHAADDELAAPRRSGKPPTARRWKSERRLASW